jgi:SAM-dependent methyltransferase
LLLESAADARTTGYLEALGVTEGWRCAELASDSGGSIVRWLCRQVGASGHVLATDIDTRFFDVDAYPNLQVQPCDIAREALPSSAFNLVHARTLPVDLAERKAALQHLARALKPGGWLLVEDPADLGGTATLACAKAIDAVRQYVTSAGFDWHRGGRLLGDVHTSGLVNVDGKGPVDILQPGTIRHRFLSLSFSRLRKPMIQAGLLTTDEADEFLTSIYESDVDTLLAMGGSSVAFWGQLAASRQVI